MPVKFKIGFQIDAETLFSIIAKFIPLDNLTVEEVFERPHGERAQPRLAATPRLMGAMKRTSERPRASLRTSFAEGMNGVILGAFDDGEPHSYGELKRLISAAGYSGSGIGSRIARLVEVGALTRTGVGAYARGKTP